MREIKDYLIYEGEQYRSPEKAEDAKDRMLSLRKKGQVARKTFTQIAKLFQEMHSDWDLHPTSQWMNQAQRLRPHFGPIYRQMDQFQSQCWLSVYTEMRIILVFPLKSVLLKGRGMRIH